MKEVDVAREKELWYKNFCFCFDVFWGRFFSFKFGLWHKKLLSPAFEVIQAFIHYMVDEDVRIFKISQALKIYVYMCVCTFYMKHQKDPVHLVQCAF